MISVKIRKRNLKFGHTVAVVAFNNHASTHVCISQIRKSGFSGNIILVDNGSDPPFDSLAYKYNCAYIRNKRNRYVNPAWNQIFKICDSRYLTLLNNDCIPKDNYLNEVIGIMQTHNLSLAVPNAVIVSDITNYAGSLEADSSREIIDINIVKDGHFMTIDMQAYTQCQFLIPRGLRIYFGDDWIFGQLRLHGYLCGQISNRYCIRETGGTTSRNPQLRSIFHKDAQIAHNSPLITQLGVFSGSIDESALLFWKNRPFYRRLITYIRDKFSLYVGEILP